MLDPAMIGTDDAIKAKDACTFDAIDLNMQEETNEIKAGAVVWDTGCRPYDANKIRSYGYDGGADMIVTPCPVCQMNVEVYQDKINAQYGTKLNIPVAYTAR